MTVPAVYIIGLSGAVGSNRFNAAELGAPFGLSGKEVTQKTGVTATYHFTREETLANVSVKVARELLETRLPAGCQISGVVASSNTTLETLIPGYATTIANALGFRHILADQVGMGCGGALQALRVAHDRLVVEALRGNKGYIVVLGGDSTTMALKPNDLPTALLFSEGVGALLVTNDPDCSPNRYRIESIGTKSALGEDLGSMTTVNPFWSPNRNYFQMDGPRVYRFAVNLIPEFLKLVGADRFEEDWFLFPHQPNLRILQAMTKNAGLPESAVYMDGIRTIGNCSTASVLLGLRDGLQRRCFFYPSNSVLLATFGAELTIGAALLRPEGNPSKIVC